MKEIWQEVDEKDSLLGEIDSKTATSSPERIHRRIAIVFYDKENRGLFWKKGDTWEIRSAPVLAGETSESAARRLSKTLGLTSPLRRAGGALVLQDRGSSQTHFFISPWSGTAPRGRNNWDLRKSSGGGGTLGPLADILLEKLRDGKMPTLREKRDLRKK